MSKTKRNDARHGFSIIEVLTSIVVAMIGVFGVMILIPFAVKQAQTGMDSDAAVQVAQNAYSQFEITGHRNPNNWMISSTTAYNPFGSSVDAPQIFSIDPLGITENGNNYVGAVFPFNQSQAGPTQYPPAGADRLFFDAVNLRIPVNSPTAMDTALARRMFRTADDLIYGEADNDLSGPVQVFDKTGTTRLRRQSRGRISWSAIVVPFKNTPLGLAQSSRWSYRMYILVYKDRSTLFGDPNGAMATAKVDTSTPDRIGVKSPIGTVFLESGAPVEEKFNRDDWVMLINRSLNEFEDGPAPMNVTYAEKGFDRQVGFFRIVNLSDGPLATITLDGPDFDFGDPADPNGLIQSTFIVHLKNVVGVYERTFEPEFESNWTTN